MLCTVRMHGAVVKSVHCRESSGRKRLLQEPNKHKVSIVIHTYITTSCTNGTAASAMTFTTDFEHVMMCNHCWCLTCGHKCAACIVV
jgi:hypothetical protein